MQWLNFDLFKNTVDVYTVVLSVIGVIAAQRQFQRHWRYRHIKKLWGFKDGDKVLLVCSELDEPVKRQLVEDREFIYLMKYGDLDAWVETIFSLLRVYPNIELWLVSAGELAQAQVDLDSHIIVIGGPDYNGLTDQLLSMKNGTTRIAYRSPDLSEKSKTAPAEIAIFDKITDSEFVGTNLSGDYGYFERISNPHDRLKNIIIIGGCHTVGVTGAAKMFSAFSNGRSDLPATVKENAKLVSSIVGSRNPFSIVCHVAKVGATVACPSIRMSRLCVGDDASCPIDHITPPTEKRAAAATVALKS